MSRLLLYGKWRLGFEALSNQRAVPGHEPAEIDDEVLSQRCSPSNAVWERKLVSLEGRCAGGKDFGKIITHASAICDVCPLLLLYDERSSH